MQIHSPMQRTGRNCASEVRTGSSVISARQRRVTVRVRAGTTVRRTAAHTHHRAACTLHACVRHPMFTFEGTSTGLQALTFSWVAPGRLQAKPCSWRAQRVALGSWSPQSFWRWGRAGALRCAAPRACKHPAELHLQRVLRPHACMHAAAAALRLPLMRARLPG